MPRTATLLAALLAALSVRSNPVHVADIRQTPAMGLDWVWDVKLAAPDLLLVTSHRDGDLHVFRRGAEGGVALLATADLNAQLGDAQRHMDPYVASSGDEVFVGGAWTHHHGDNDSIGLLRYGWDAATEKLTFRSHQPTPACDDLLVSPDGRSLYAAMHYARAVQVFRLRGTEPPEPTQSLGGEGRGSKLALSPDGKTLYSSHREGISWFAVGTGGVLSEGGTLKIGDLAEPARYSALSVSPDGRHVYWAVVEKNRQGCVWTVPRSAVDGSLTAGRDERDPVFSGVTGIAWVSPERALFSGGPESPAGGMGWFDRDPTTGALSNADKLRATPAWSLAYDPVAKLAYLGGFWSSKHFSVYRLTDE
jgi:WD40 repeat protein